MKTVLIEVTAEDIRHGHAGDCSECPVAYASSRATGRHCLVGRRSMTVHGVAEVQLPWEARRFISDFDSLWAMKPQPFSFTIELPEDT